jgi:uncharacterized protein
MYYSRILENVILEDLKTFPVIAILGPRQSGKTTLSNHIITHHLKKPVLYLDLERPSHLRKLEDAEWFLSEHRDHFICIDEIQRRPELFPLLRSLSDEWGSNGHFLILGSASIDLIRQSSESLAGRISYHRLRPFTSFELKGDFSQEELLLKGGFPRSLLNQSNQASQRWRENFITTFVERDLFQWKSLSPQTMQRLIQMLAHLNGQLLNFSALANSLDVSSVTVRNYMDILTGAFIIEMLPPFLSNAGKRVSKSPKLYFTDTGLITALKNIQTISGLLGHPALGALWESFVLHHIRAQFPMLQVFYYRTSHGAELDFILEYGGKILAVECKSSLAPNLGKGNYISFEDTKAQLLLVVAPVKSGWRIREKVFVQSVKEAMIGIADFFQVPLYR